MWRLFECVVEALIAYLHLKCPSRGHYLDYVEAMRMFVEAVILRKSPQNGRRGCEP